MINFIKELLGLRCGYCKDWDGEINVNFDLFDFWMDCPKCKGGKK